MDSIIKSLVVLDTLCNLLEKNRESTCFKISILNTNLERGRFPVSFINNKLLFSNSYSTYLLLNYNHFYMK